jgi:hypothetical protein
MSTNKVPVLNEWYPVLRHPNGQMEKIPLSEDLYPEGALLCLAGKVYGRESYKNGTPIITSPIIGVHDEDTVMTKSGSVYKLGSVAPDYEQAAKTMLQFFKENLPPILPRSQGGNMLEP